ncbi:MAG: hypothetical protein QOJ50_1349 [Cryptosporangiaceae bacterium]|nr:hypothetical protein [Cryptosporangiaceae bacterium]
MTGATGRPAHGRRNNGLDARAFTAVGDLDPRIGEHLLDVLAIAGIAAYLQPSSDFNPIVRSTTLPSRPTDRLWVDSEHTEDAKALITQVDTESLPTAPDEAPREQSTLTASGGGLDVDAAWAEIVAGFDTPPTGQRNWPDAEDAVSGRASNGPDSLVWADHLRPLSGGTAQGPRDHTLAEPADGDLDGLHEPDEGYEPPPPPPLPTPSRHAVLGVVAIIAGFILFLRPSLLPVAPTVAMIAGVAGILGGAGLLVFRLRDGLDPEDDDPDDGAVV